MRQALRQKCKSRPVQRLQLLHAAPAPNSWANFPRTFSFLLSNSANQPKVGAASTSGLILFIIYTSSTAPMFLFNRAGKKPIVDFRSYENKTKNDNNQSNFEIFEICSNKHVEVLRLNDTEWQHSADILAIIYDSPLLLHCSVTRFNIKSQRATESQIHTHVQQMAPYR